MEKHIGVWLFVVVFWAGLDYSFTQDKVSKPAYFLVGGNLKLEVGPGVTEPIANILWKHNGNLLAEWVKDVVELTYFSIFKGSTTLDTKTGRLEMTKMTPAHNGVYTVEINSKMQHVSYVVKSIEKVPEPEVVVKPSACNETCKVSCEGNIVGAGPVTYSWKKWVEGGTELEQLEPMSDTTKDLEINKTGSADIHYFICIMKNPVSEKESESKNNPFFYRPPPTWPLIIGLIFVGIAVAGGVGVSYWKRAFLREFFSKPSDDGLEGNVATTDYKSAEPNELDTLKSNGDNAIENPAEPV